PGVRLRPRLLRPHRRAAHPQHAAARGHAPDRPGQLVPARPPRPRPAPARHRSSTSGRSGDHGTPRANPADSISVAADMTRTQPTPRSRGSPAARGPGRGDLAPALDAPESSLSSGKPALAGFPEEIT